MPHAVATLPADLQASLKSNDLIESIGCVTASRLSYSSPGPLADDDVRSLPHPLLRGGPNHLCRPQVSERVLSHLRPFARPAVISAVTDGPVVLL